MKMGTNITIGIAFLAGLSSFLSPCVLPLVPAYLSLISGVSIDRLKQQRAVGFTGDTEDSNNDDV